MSFDFGGVVGLLPSMVQQKHFVNPYWEKCDFWISNAFATD